MSKLITLAAWAKEVYGDAAPKSPTLCTWARTGKIQPPPEKHGREYFVVPDAHYVTASSNPDNREMRPEVERAIHRPVTQGTESAVDLIDRILRERKEKARKSR